MSLYQQYVNALAAYTVPLESTKGLVAYMPVKWSGPNTKTPVTINMLVDTGAQNSSISGEFVKALGIDLKNTGTTAISSTFQDSWVSYRHYLTMQVSNLKPITNVPVYIASKSNTLNLLGWNGVLSRVRLEITGGFKKPQLEIAELAQSAMANAQAFFRSRV